jgi:flagellar protein FliO/FliZ
MNTLFGVSLPTPVNFIIAFVIVLVLIAATTWVVRRFGATRLNAAARGRQPRLAVVDSAAVDARRKLVIIRRDNVEHLLMIGGPSDVVVETNIVRAVAATREPGPVRNGAAETVPRPSPPVEPTSWSQQPDPVPTTAPAHVLRADRGPRGATTNSMASTGPTESDTVPPPPARAARSADPLASLATELSLSEAEPLVAAARVKQAGPAQASTSDAPKAPPSAPPTVPTTDQSLAEMAQRLEAALRRPPAPQPTAEGTARAVVAPEAKSAKDPSLPVAPSGAAAQPQTPKNNFEQEMANLLIRTEKT